MVWVILQLIFHDTSPPFGSGNRTIFYFSIPPIYYLDLPVVCGVSHPWVSLRIYGRLRSLLSVKRTK